MSSSAMESKCGAFLFVSATTAPQERAGAFKSICKHKHLMFSSSTEHLFNLKFAVKELERNSKKCEKEEKLEKAKAKKAIQKGNMDVARIHAENAIRQKSQSVNYLRMSARVDAVSSRVQSALTTRNVRVFCQHDASHY